MEMGERANKTANGNGNWRNETEQNEQGKCVKEIRDQENGDEK